MVAIGCTGGRHRSVAIAGHLAERYGDSTGLSDRGRPPRRRAAGSSGARGQRVIDHVGFEVADLARSARFYDAVFGALGARRMYESEHAVAYGITSPVGVDRRPRTRAGPGYGHMALQASGKAAVDAAHTAGLGNGGSDDGPPARRPAVRSPLLRGLPARSRRAAGRSCLAPITASLGPSDALAAVGVFCRPPQEVHTRMPVRVGINGFGRIGRNVFRAALRARRRHRVGRHQRPGRSADDRAPAQVRLELRAVPGGGHGERRRTGRRRQRDPGAGRARPGGAAVGRARRRGRDRVDRALHRPRERRQAPRRAARRRS